MKIRKALPSDVEIILELIIELATYEKMASEVVATKEILTKWLFEKKTAQVLLCEVNNEVIGYCLYFYNFSTFLGKSGIYIEDVYIKKEHRGNGYGKEFFYAVSQIAVDEGCGRVDWVCLDWNKPSIDFYLSIGAVPQEGWTIYRLSGIDLENIANRKK